MKILFFLNFSLIHFSKYYIFDNFKAEKKFFIDIKSDQGQLFQLSRLGIHCPD